MLAMELCTHECIVINGTHAKRFYGKTELHLVMFTKPHKEVKEKEFFIGRLKIFRLLNYSLYQ